MKSKKVTRYWCDFCKKASLQAHSMRKHEAHCTLNPDRKCRVCTLINGGDGCDISELKAMLPDATEFNALAFWETGGDNAYTRLNADLNICLPALREAADNCPACIMAALRQSKIPVPMVEGFDFKTEMQAVFSVFNDARQNADFY